MYHYKLFYHVEIFRKKRSLVDVNAKYFLLKIKIRGKETKWRRLEDVGRSTEMISRGLEVILQIWRLGCHFCGAHVVSAPPSPFTHVFCSLPPSSQFAPHLSWTPRWCSSSVLDTQVPFLFKLPFLRFNLGY